MNAKKQTPLINTPLGQEVLARLDRKPPSISARARAAGLSPALVYSRVYHGWSVERALAEPRHRRGRPIDPDSLAQQARRARISRDTVVSRLRRGWPMDEAVWTAARARRAGK